MSGGDELVQAVLKDLQPWASELENSLKAEIAAKGLIDTGFLGGQLRVEVVKAAELMCTITFPGYGRIQDIRAMPRKIPRETSALRRYIAGVGYNATRTKYGKKWYNKTVWREVQKLSDIAGNAVEDFAKDAIVELFVGKHGEVSKVVSDYIKL